MKLFMELNDLDKFFSCLAVFCVLVCLMLVGEVRAQEFGIGLSDQAVVESREYPDTGSPEEVGAYAPEEFFIHFFQETNGMDYSGSELVLSPRLLVHLVASRNAENLHSLLQVTVNEQMARAALGIYDPMLFSALRYDDINQPRQEDWQSLFFGTDTKTVLERSYNLEGGVRQLLPTGGDVTVSYRFKDRNSNLLPDDQEYTGTLVFQLRQPILRGLGKTVTEADLQVARLDHDISKQRYKQQVLMSCGEALRAYWQLYRAQENLQISELALLNANQILEDVLIRVERGWSPRTDLLEARSAIAAREADLARFTGLMDEVRSRILTLLNVAGSVPADLRFRAGSGSDITDGFPGDAPDVRLNRAMENWPGLIVAEKTRDQEDIRLKYARNQRLPKLDLVGGYSLHSLDEKAKKAFDDAWSNHHPSWYVGLNIEAPLGNRQAGSQFEAQKTRVLQADLEIEYIRNSLTNELNARWKQLLSAHQEVLKMAHDVELRKELLAAEQAQYKRGRAPLRRVFERENEVNESKRRQVESIVRMELARVSLMLADVSLLDEYGLDIADLQEK